MPCKDDVCRHESSGGGVTNYETEAENFFVELFQKMRQSYGESVRQMLMEHDGGDFDVEEEKRLEQQKKPLPIRDFLKSKGDSFATFEPRSFTYDEITNSGLTSGNKLKVLQAIDFMVNYIENVNDWIAIYAVLVEREYIPKTMTTFCSMVNSLFAANISSSYMSKVLKSHGESIDKWKPVYDDHRRHIEIASMFRKTLIKMGMT